MIYTLHDVCSKDFMGGAALILENLNSIPGAPDKIELLTAKEFSREKVIGHPLIVGRIETFHHEDLRWIAETQNYIKSWFDYGYCRFQNGGLGHNCAKTCKHRFGGYQRLIDGAKLNIYQSPGQMRKHAKHLELKNNVCWIGPTDIDLFLCSGTEKRDDIYFGFGPEAEHKGYPHVKILFSDLHVVRGKTREEVADFMKHSRYYVHLPLWYEPTPCAGVEAYLAGCEMIVNRHMLGMFSYPWDYYDKDNIIKNLQDHNESFWPMAGPLLGY